MQSAHLYFMTQLQSQIFKFKSVIKLCLRLNRWTPLFADQLTVDIKVKPERDITHVHNKNSRQECHVT